MRNSGAFRGIFLSFNGVVEDELGVTYAASFRTPVVSAFDAAASAATSG